MQVASAAQFDSTALTPGLVTDPKLNMRLVGGDAESGNSAFGALLNSFEELPKALEQPNHTLTNKLVPNLPHLNSDPKVEVSKKVGKTDPQNPLQVANGNSQGNAAPATPAPPGGGSAPAQATSPLPAQDTAAPKSNLNSPNLAFAVRVSAPGPSTPSADAPPVQSPKENSAATVSQESEPAARNIFLSAVTAPVVAAVLQRENGGGANKDGQEFAGGEQQPALPAAPSPPAPIASAPAAPADFDSELKSAAGTARGAHIQLVGNGNQRVDIQLLERGGGLAVSVRSSDATLTRTLQDHIPELTARLDSEHFRSEAWTPAAAASSGGRDARNGGSFTGQGGSSNGGGDQQRQRDGQRPKWVQELEENQNKISAKERFYVSSK